MLLPLPFSLALVPEKRFLSPEGLALPTASPVLLERFSADCEFVVLLN
jgi:hypothetical protein